MTKDRVIELLTQSIKWFLPYTVIKEEWTDAMNMAIESLQTETEWILCSERLPSMRTEVIYSYDGIVSTGYMTDRDCIGEKTEEHWEDLESGAYIKPIAWMPLPKPYREDGEA